jgi:tryptophan-rich sensory protein
MNRYLKLTLCILLPLLIGGISGYASASGINIWYMGLNKPFFNPPNYLFGPVWSMLYILMGISFYRILQSQDSELKRKAILIFCIQLFLNFCWSFLFFRFQMLAISFIEIIIMWISIATMIYTFTKIDKTAAYLQIPYLLWVSFANILNGAIWFLN